MWEKIHTHKKYMYFSPDVENNVWKYVKKKSDTLHCFQTEARLERMFYYIYI